MKQGLRPVSSSSPRMSLNTNTLDTGTGRFTSPRNARSVNSPRRPAGRQKAEPVESYKALIHDNLSNMMQILLKANAAQTVHDVSLFSQHLHSRAESAIAEELAQLTERLERMQGPNPQHQLTAYTQLSANVLRDLERVAVFSDHKQAISNIRDNNQSLRNEAARNQAQLTEDLGRKSQALQMLEAEKTQLEYKNNSLIRAVELLNKELEKATRSLSEIHQKNVELCMQGLDFKAEVEHGAAKILESIKARVGFVPTTVQKQVARLHEVKPPGDPSYDHIRSLQRKQASQRRRSSSNSNSSTAANSTNNNGNSNGNGSNGHGHVLNQSREVLDLRDTSRVLITSTSTSNTAGLPDPPVLDRRFSNASWNSTSEGHTDRRSSTSSDGGRRPSLSPMMIQQDTTNNTKDEADNNHDEEREVETEKEQQSNGKGSGRYRYHQRIESNPATDALSLLADDDGLE